MTSTADAIRTAATTIESAAREQRRAEPHHIRFHDLARAVERTTAALHDITTCLGDQLAGYHRNRQLRSDINLDPADLLEEAVHHCDTLRIALDDARTAADQIADRCGRLTST